MSIRNFNVKTFEEHPDLWTNCVGKSYLACAFGQWACRYGFTVHYNLWPGMPGDILAGRGKELYLKHLQKLTKVDLLIIDALVSTLCRTPAKKIA